MPIYRLKKSSIKTFEVFRKFSAAFSRFSFSGNEIKQIGDYFYHIFTSSETFTTIRDGNFEVASIGAGGEGGYNCGGGGGGAEVDTFFSVIGTAGEYSIVVGSGNANDRGADTVVSRGPTTFVTTLGGGNGGHHDHRGPWTGGSGGGASDSNAGASGSGANTNSGGSGKNVSNPTNWGGGGGGGATGSGAAATGSNGNNVAGGAGGQGLLLTDIDTNFTSTNFNSFAEMTRVSSGASGTLNSRPSSNPVGNPGTGAGSAFRPQGTDTGSDGESPATRPSSFGSGSGGGTTGGAVDAYPGVVIIRYPRNQ